MSAPKFTPGPWTQNGAAIESRNHSYGGNDALIAHVYGPEDNGAPEYRANTHLIAAAPELYEALEALVNGPLGGLIGDAFDRRSVLLDAARAALAKARGES